jgi:hypothetical protein
MKSNLFRTAFLVVIALLPFHAFLSAQDAAPAGTNVSLKIDFIAWGDDGIKDLRISTDGKNTPVSAAAFEYSKAVSYSGSNILQLSQGAVPQGTPATVAPPADGAAKLSELDKRRLKDPSIVALALLPSNSKRVTILLVPADKGTYNTFVIDDDPLKLPLGTLRIHNLCPFPIAMRCNGKAPVELKLKQTTTATPVDKVVSYELGYKEAGNWVVQEKNIVRVDEKEQTQFIVLKSDASHFTSSDGSRGGFLQTVTLRRSAKEMVDSAPNP